MIAPEIILTRAIQVCESLWRMVATVPHITKAQITEPKKIPKTVIPISWVVRTVPVIVAKTPMKSAMVIGLPRVRKEVKNTVCQKPRALVLISVVLILLAVLIS